MCIWARDAPARLIKFCVPISQGPAGRTAAKRYLNASKRDGPDTALKTLQWARHTFREQTSLDILDESLNLGYLSLLIAIEDEAATEVFHESSYSIAEQAVLNYCREYGTEAEKAWTVSVGMSEAPTLAEIGTSSTWNLARLDSLAHAALAQLCGELDLGKLEWHGPDESSTEDSPPAGSHQPAKNYPMLAIFAVNEVLFVQQGYQGLFAGRKEDPRGHQLPYVMERGSGSPASLAILYLEICQRIGLPMHATILEEGRYVILWPKDNSLLLDGEEVVVDVYSEGALFLLSEVRQLFDLGPGPLPIASRRQILAALLTGLRDVYWCKAIGCRTEPALTVPLKIRTALSGEVPITRNYNIHRAVAAAQRSCFVFPEDKDLGMSLALLLYFSGQFKASLQLLEELDYPDTKELAAKVKLMAGQL